MLGDFPIKGKIVLITGGGSGIGLAFSTLCLSLGCAHLLIGDLKLEPGAQTLLSQHPQTAHFLQTDVRDWKQLRALIEHSEREFGDVPDIYVPNAGIFEPRWSNFWDDEEDEGYAAVRINVEHPIKLSRMAIRALLRRDKKGVILCVSSASGLRSKYGSALYCATKHAVVGFVKGMGLCEELEGVKVVCICPGRIITPLWTKRDDLDSFDVDEGKCLPVADLAKTMGDLVQMGKYSGGTIYLRSMEDDRIAIEGMKEAGTPRDKELPQTKRVQKLLEGERQGKKN